MTGSQGRSRLILLAGLATVLVTILAGLGVWQVQRLAWKTDLIARTEAQLAAPPVTAPGPDDWGGITSRDEYRRVTVTGEYQSDRDALVQAVTDYGPGFWVMTPLQTQDGLTVWINRGFVPQDRREASDRELPAGKQQVSGLLRVSQPDGAFLRANLPAESRWYSRDVQALSQTYNVANAAPYFIDAPRNGDDLPIGGLTVIKFRNSHLSYALTWFAMAIGLAAVSVVLLRREWRGSDRSRS